MEELEKKTCFESLPKDVLISTITVVCKTNTKFISENILKYFKINNDAIIFNGEKTKKKKRKRQKDKRYFYNQISFRVKVKSKNKPIHVKLFVNGSLHITGCKTIENINEVINVVFEKLRKLYAIKINGHFEEKPMITDINGLEIKTIDIVMINSSFKIPLCINRHNLFVLLQSNKIQCNFDPQNYAPVTIKFECNDKIITILIFEKGSIIIAGATNCNHIKTAYTFINKFIYSNIKNVIKIE